MIYMNVTLDLLYLGHAVLFLHLCDLGRKAHHKATTPNCIPLGAFFVASMIAIFKIYLRVKVHVMSNLQYNSNRRVNDVLLGSSLPNMGGGTMKKFRKIDVLILILKLLVHLIDWFK